MRCGMPGRGSGIPFALEDVRTVGINKISNGFMKTQAADYLWSLSIPLRIIDVRVRFRSGEMVSLRAEA